MGCYKEMCRCSLEASPDTLRAKDCGCGELGMIVLEFTGSHCNFYATPMFRHFNMSMRPHTLFLSYAFSIKTMFLNFCFQIWYLLKSQKVLETDIFSITLNKIIFKDKLNSVIHL